MRETTSRETIEGMTRTAQLIVAAGLIAGCGPATNIQQGSIPPPTGTIEGFYCNALSQCWTTEPECPRCARIERAWCAVYATGVDSYPERLMCGISRSNCTDLVWQLRGGYAHRHGECVQRMAGR